MKNVFMFTALMIVGTIAQAGSSATEQWQCYTYHTGNSALIGRECQQKAYEAGQLLGKPARCEFGTQNYCESSGWAEVGVFAIVWPK